MSPGVRERARQLGGQDRMNAMLQWAVGETRPCASLRKCAMYGVVTVSVPDIPHPVPVQRLCSSPLNQIRRAKAARLIAIARGEANHWGGGNALAREYVASVFAHSPDEMDFTRSSPHLVAAGLDRLSFNEVRPRSAREALISYATGPLGC